jgi:hypothetical protein
MSSDKYALHSIYLLPDAPGQERGVAVFGDVAAAPGAHAFRTKACEVRDE